MQKFLLLTVLSLFSYIAVTAQTPFAGCGDAFYLLSGEGEPNPTTTLHTIDTTTLAAASFGSTSALQINGAGYNQVDNLIYGMSDDDNDGTPNLHVIDATGAQTLIDVVNPPAPGPGDFGAAVLWGIGDIDQNGVYHFPGVIVRDIATEDYDIYLGTIDLTGPLSSPIMPTYTLMSTAAGGCQPLIDTYVTALVAYYLNGSTGPQPDGGIQDWAFNPLDGKLYSYLGVEGYVFELSSTGEATCHDATSNGTLNQFGAIFFDRSGDMHGFNSVTGESYTIDYASCPGAACGGLTAGATHTPDQRLDAVSCPWPLPPPPATVPFAGCENAFFLTTNDSGGPAMPSTLSNIDTNTIAATPFGNQLPFAIGGMGYNQVDNFLYGMNDMENDGTPELYQIDANGDYTNLTTIALPGPGAFGEAILWHIADVDQNGIFYFPAVVVENISPADYTVYLGAIDLASPTTAPTYTVMNTSGGCQGFVDAFVADLIDFYLGIGPEPEGGIQDWAFNPNDGLLYSYLGFESSVFTLDVTTGNTNCYSTPNGGLTQFGGIFFDHSGDMYGIETDAGNTWMIDVSACPGATCGTLTAGAPIAPGSRGDAASCPWPITPVLTPFEPCGSAYVSQATLGGGATAPTDLSTLDTATLAATPFGSQLPFGINAIGYNGVDNLLYGMNDMDDDGTPELYQIGANGNYINLGTINTPAPATFGAAVLWTVGDVDENGNYYFPAVVVNNVSPPDYDLYLGMINLTVPVVTPIQPVYTPIITATGGCQPFVDAFVADLVDFYLNGGPEPMGGIQDWGFNPDNGLLYSYLGIEAAVFTLDVTTGQTNCYQTGNASLGQFGGIFFDETADMYGIESPTGTVYTIDVSGGCPTAPCGDLTAGPSIGGANSDAAENIIGCDPLPLELISFTGRKDRFDVLLDWTTSYEENVNSFIVEKSANGFDFTKLGEVRAVGNSSQENDYQFEDENPFPGLNYYRLTFIDLDGQREVYPHLVVIDMEKGSLYFTVNPNPTSDKIRVEMVSVFDKELWVEIFDVTGKLMLETTIAPKQFFKEIDVEHLSPGLYMLKAKNGVQGYVQRFVKQ